MRGLKSLTAVLVGVALLGGVMTASAGAAAYKHYVGCGASQSTDPSHVCPAKSKKGAFFESTKADVVYSICVKFPTGKSDCASGQKARKGRLYVNKITTEIPGRHKVTWFVKGKRVGAFTFRVKP